MPVNNDCFEGTFGPAPASDATMTLWLGDCVVEFAESSERYRASNASKMADACVPIRGENGKAIRVRLC